MHPTHSQPAPLTPVQLKVVSALTAGVPVTAAAKAAGLHRSTIYVWQKTNSAFAAALAQAQQDRLRGLTRETNLKTILAAPPPIRTQHSHSLNEAMLPSILDETSWGCQCNCRYRSFVTTA